MFPSFKVTGSSLNLLRKGERGIVKFYKSQDKIILEKLRLMGVTPGTSITLEQHFPSLIVKIGQKRLTLDQEIARVIYVRIDD
jgi:ferrous iron transport protein A